MDIGYSVKRMIKPYKFSPDATNKIEANNLQVDTNMLESINEGLERPVPASHYLTGTEVRELRKCGVDLSLINPGISSLWHPVSKEKKETIHHNYDEYFPRPEDKVIFKGVNMRGHASAKIKTKFMRNGKWYKLKVKI